MRVLIAESLHPAGAARLRAAGHEVIERPALAASELAGALRDVHALVVGGEARVAEAALRGAAVLRVVARAGTGLENVDVVTAQELGIVVGDTPAAAAAAVAEHAFALLLALERQIPRADAEVRGGIWPGRRSAARELAGRTLGIVGLGRVGREVAWRARAFAMEVRWCDPLLELTPAGYEWTRRATLEELLPEVDVLSLHASLGRGTRGLIGARELARLRPDAVLVNCAHGGLVDERALHDALVGGRLRGAALDVFAAEPPGQSPLLALPSVVATPHVGGATLEAGRRAALAAAALVLDVLAQETDRS